MPAGPCLFCLMNYLAEELKSAEVGCHSGTKTLLGLLPFHLDYDILSVYVFS